MSQARPPFFDSQSPAQASPPPPPRRPPTGRMACQRWRIHLWPDLIHSGSRRFAWNPINAQLPTSLRAAAAVTACKKKEHLCHWLTGSVIDIWLSMPLPMLLQYLANLQGIAFPEKANTFALCESTAITPECFMEHSASF